MLFRCNRKVLPQYQGRGVFSLYFLIPKERDGLNPILDLQKYMKKLWFHMVSLITIIPSLNLGGQYVALILRDVYFHLAIHRGPRKLLRFIV